MAAGTPSGAKKATATKLAKDPNFFSKISRQAKKPRGGKASSGSFTPKNAAKLGRAGGKKSKRGPAKKILEIKPRKTGELKDFPLRYEEIKK